MMKSEFWPQCSISWKMWFDRGDWPTEEGEGLKQHSYPFHLAL